MAQGYSLKDQLFNEGSIGDLAAEFAAGVPGFDADAFQADVMAGLAGRGLLERLDWIADCLEPRLSADFPQMAEQLEAAMVPPLDPLLSDDDFGRFIHAVPGILAVRHGLEAHRERALDLLFEATKRFSMEFYIRPFLNRWPDKTMARLEQWAEDENYHVRRLVSEGTRPKLPWASKIDLEPGAAVPLLDRLHGDRTRFVTRSVANHLNDIAKSDPDCVVDTLLKWRDRDQQNRKELDWMTRHALRSLIKQGHVGALGLLGYRSDVDVSVEVSLATNTVRIGEELAFECQILTQEALPVLVDYVLHFNRPSGRPGRKVYKLKQGKARAGEALVMSKRHKLKGDATTFTLHPGPHRIELQVNGRIVADAEFELLPGQG